MRKTTIFTLTLLSLTILPAMAQIQTGALGQVWTDFQSYSTDLQNYLQYNLSDNLKPVEVQSQNALSNSKGELNIPNPVLAGQRVRDNLILYSSNSDSRAGRFENNSAVQGNLISNELNRVITRGVAVGILGEKGQIRTKSKLESTERSLQDIAKIADETNASNNTLLSTIKGFAGATNATPETKALSSLAELLGLSQVQILKIQQEQVKIVAETFSQSLQNNQSLQYSNLNLANISQQAEEANRARRVETSTEAARLLRATSQLDLFGRKLNN
ncbi:MAG: hypothetical protein HWQ35_30355 [Nostoc sp. NMS1]|uniref:hypothetical protein n=1 Tax=unclassified Nostoc TaxID=2593658 RepID=UPI0025EDB9D1|nr:MULTISPECIES: hypothetical protein [unclassified Nostoc]MBN3910682.1 hypothetical protein [Nostoc sp. NMS1]MBN3993115.1 hypothetical protein [Nostoc sp. NMS2]